MISIVIPVFNEEENVVLLSEKLENYLNSSGFEAEVIFVDDGSTDATLERLREVAKGNKKIKIVQLHRNFGQTAALMAGFDRASGEVIFPMDGDLQNDPEDITKLFEKLQEGYDVVSGWRKERKDGSLIRTLPSKLASRLISKISGIQLHDYGCTLKAYRKEILSGVKLYGEMHRLIPIFASWRGARVTELTVRHHPRIHGKSKYGLGRVFKVILDLCVVQFLDRYLTKSPPRYSMPGAIGRGLIFSIAVAALGIIPTTAHAYIDPGAGSLILQVLLGGITCVLILAKTYWRKFTGTGEPRKSDDDSTAGKTIRPHKKSHEE